MSLTKKQLLAGRWRVACINWTHPDAPHAVAYLAIDHPDGTKTAEYSAYFTTWTEALGYAVTRARKYAEIRERARLGLGGDRR
ncbi:hypothetical protein [Nocardioides sp. R-C-SC26]|uniref:hypothetical protein n=1 Tax=Nocardioides sp. R-C-SC26 TaxID=2870414 RepID=UPI001E38FC47|nr:hypothetical protein [Nocardioides sp. R-C-SC26]